MKRRRGNLYQRKAGGNYYFRIMVNGRTVVKSTGTPNRREAEKERVRLSRIFQATDEREMLRDVADKFQDAEAKTAKLEEELNPPPRIKHVFNRFLQSPERTDAGERTLQGYESSWTRFEKWLDKHHSDIEHLHEVKPAIAKEYAKHLKDCKVSASTFNQHKNLLKMVWRVMADECRLDSNPWEKMQGMKLNPLQTRKRALTQSQYEDALAAAETDSDLKDLFTVLAWTGLRLGDAALLQWSSVDFKRRVISLAPAKTARRQGKLVYIPFFPATEEVLNRRQGQLVNPRGYVFPELAEQYERDPQKLNKRIQTMFESAGIKTSEERAGRGRAVVLYGAHSFRHFFVTAAASAGMPSAMIKAITGHTTDNMLEHYQQLGADIVSNMAKQIKFEGGAKQITPGNVADSRLNEIRVLVDGMNGKNWKKVKEQVLARL